MLSELPLLPDDLRAALTEFMAGQSTLVLATTGEQDGRPQATPLFFAADEEFNLYWVSSPDSRHSTNIADWDVAEAAIFVQTWDWTGIKGVQLAGNAEAVADDEERARALSIYKAKFPFVNDRFEDVIEDSILYVLRPSWVRWLDNERHFGYRQEFRIEPPERPS
ncbi:pyridoxamine 5'-phosphate oxidase family protein [Aggregatilinea lenta]|uniref:pyridoxamine 5'-phosphate oxidase family protein n=1 Tax=Aggregatilinea lenta TaxID=913108 RepID=UPI000E5AD89F|nr:pyridoxamine 5'-phosphate oxidase family protein [Aggregatilinea lenta]